MGAGEATGVAWAGACAGRLVCAACGVPHDWWTVDLCFWPHAWEVTAQSKKFLDKMRDKYAAA